MLEVELWIEQAKEGSSEWLLKESWSLATGPLKITRYGVSHITL